MHRERISAQERNQETCNARFEGLVGMIKGAMNEMKTRRRSGGWRSTTSGSSGDGKKEDHQREEEQPPQNRGHEDEGCQPPGEWPEKQRQGELASDTSKDMETLDVQRAPKQQLPGKSQLETEEVRITLEGKSFDALA